MCNIDLAENDKLLALPSIAVTAGREGVNGKVGEIGVTWDPSSHRVVERCVSRMCASITCILGDTNNPTSDLMVSTRGREKSGSQPPAPSSPTNVNISITRSVLTLHTSPVNMLVLTLSRIMFG
eukprot:sb/3475738/